MRVPGLRGDLEFPPEPVLTQWVLAARDVTKAQILGKSRQTDPSVDAMAALKVPKHGKTYSLAKHVIPGSTGEIRMESWLRPPANIRLESLCLPLHGFRVTHMDLPGHAPLPEKLKGEPLATDEYPAVLKAVMVDILDLTDGRPLEPGTGIAARDVLEAIEYGGASVHPGDALLIHSGAAALPLESMSAHVGLMPDVAMLARDLGLSLIASDCIDRRPVPYRDWPLPVHQLLLGLFGIPVLDNLDFRLLRDACLRHGRREFMLALGVIPIKGATGLPATPIAVF